MELTIYQIKEKGFRCPCCVSFLIIMQYLGQTFPLARHLCPEYTNIWETAGLNSEVKYVALEEKKTN